jgi:hypothetical protein
MATTPKKTAKKSKDMGSARVSAKDVKKVPKDRPKPNVKQDKPNAAFRNILQNDKYDFDEGLGPKKTIPLMDRASRLQAAKAMKKVSPKRPQQFSERPGDKLGYKGGR